MQRISHTSSLHQVVLFQKSAVSFGGFIALGGRNMGEVMVLCTSVQSKF
jgi:hypothetical protein